MKQSEMDVSSGALLAALHDELADRIRRADAMQKTEKLAGNVAKEEHAKGRLYELHGLRQFLAANAPADLPAVAGTVRRDVGEDAP